jgi:hypothetical protein
MDAIAVPDAHHATEIARTRINRISAFSPQPQGCQFKIHNHFNDFTKQTQIVHLNKYPGVGITPRCYTHIWTPSIATCPLGGI